MIAKLFALCAFLFCGALPFVCAEQDEGYMLRRKNGDLNFDGHLDDAVWKDKLIVTTFYKSKKMGPAKYNTEVYGMWDDENLYFGAKMMDEDIVGTMANRDDPIYNEDAFEIFVRPDCDTNFIYEFEFSPRGVIFDCLNRRNLNPYSCDPQGKAAVVWNAEGLACAVYLDGTLNNHTDRDAFWSVEIKIPFKVFETIKPISDFRKKKWAITFARCESSIYLEKPEWSSSVAIGKYGFWENYAEWRPLFFVENKPIRK